ncbi:hypothetical protein [Thiothrix subterranea]|uniref:hypothetical protein n=1 Tax=Thiothrix subterranea TaxID=2735563 RepID=UPI00280AAFB3|nr:hypothetical protein [Thiothrix subterranea]
MRWCVRYWRAWRFRENGLPPILTETELQALYQRARSATADASLQNLLEQRQAGDVASRYRGAGLDYAESRPTNPATNRVSSTGALPPALAKRTSNSSAKNAAPPCSSS